MKAVHRGLRIRNRHFNAMGQDLDKTLGSPQPVRRTGLVYVIARRFMNMDDAATITLSFPDPDIAATARHRGSCSERSGPGADPGQVMFSSQDTPNSSSTQPKRRPNP